MGTLLQKLEYLEQTKVDIREALQARGSKVTTEDTFRSYVEYINKLQTGTPSGTAGTLNVNGATGFGNRNIETSDLRMPNITYIAAGNQRISVEWDAITEATNYRVFTFLSNTYTKIGDTTSTSYSVTGLENGVEYGIYVIAYINHKWLSSDRAHIRYAIPTA